MLLEKKWIGSIAAILMMSLFIINGCGEKTSEEKIAEEMTEQSSNETTALADIDMGLPMYPGAEQDPGAAANQHTSHEEYKNIDGRFI